MIVMVPTSVVLIAILCIRNSVVVSERIQTKVCHGTNNKLSRSQDPDMQYQYTVNDFKDCTHIIGNLEVIGISKFHNSSFNLNFLSSIQVVTGYIVFVEVYVDVIPLTSLIHVRGESNLDLGFGEFSFSLIYVETREIQLPKLKDVSGKPVLLFDVTACNLDTVDWHAITGRHDNIAKDVTSPDECEACSPECPLVAGIRRCWGSGPLMCQQMKTTDCHWSCETRLCYKEGVPGCCHPTCAVGCSGPLDTDCELCRGQKYNDRCVRVCPLDTFPHGPDCVPLKLFSTE